MPLTPEEKSALLTIQREVHEVHADMADLKAKVIQHGADIRSHQSRLDRHDYRIGALELHTGIGPVANPMTNPRAYARAVATSIPPPRSPEELGLKATDSGTTWKTKDVGMIVQRFEEQEQQRLGAEQALELERKNFDRKLRNVSTIAGLIVLVVGAAVGAVTYLYTHVSASPSSPQQQVVPDQSKR
jgi:hypothetical protein